MAVLAVIAFHSGLPLPGGFTGVDVFFVISGFVITELILRQRAQGTFTFKRFYARRAQRLLPALAVMVAIVFVASLLFQSPFGEQQITADTGIGAMLLAANIVITRTLGDYFSPEAISNPLLHTWSLSVEEQFYLFFPFLLIIALGFSARGLNTRFRKRAIAFVAALSLVSLLLCIAWTRGWSPLGLTNQPEVWAFYLSPARAWEFGVGALLSLLGSRWALLTNSRHAQVLAAFGLLLVLLSFLAISEGAAFPGPLALLPVLGTAALIAAGGHSNSVSRFLSARPMVRIGDWSYSLYLWHWPLIVFAVLLWPSRWSPLIAAAISFPIAAASYHFLENPIRFMALSARTVAIAGVSMSAVVITIGVGLAQWGGALLPDASRLNTERATPSVSQEFGCFVQDHFDSQNGQRYLDNCEFTTPNSRGWVLLAGDSHASHASSAVIAAAHARGLDVFTLTGGACPFLRSPPPFSDVDNCDALNNFVWSQVGSDNPPRAVILGSKGALEEAEATVSELAKRGIPVVWLRTVPRWTSPDDGIQRLPCTGGIANFSCEYARSEVEANTAQYWLSEDVLLDRHPEIVEVDARGTFCGENTCTPIQEGKLRYVDNEHLNGLGSELLADSFGEALDEALGRSPGDQSRGMP